MGGSFNCHDWISADKMLIFASLQPGLLVVETKRVAFSRSAGAKTFTACIDGRIPDGVRMDFLK